MLKDAMSSLRRILSGGLAGTHRLRRAEAAVPEGMRIYAIGDIHGRADLLKALHAQIRADASGADVPRKVILYLGDYVDRGLQSRETVDLVLAGVEGFEQICLKGNHEEALLNFLDDPAFGATWKYYGGLETLHSYGVKDLIRKDDPQTFIRVRDDFRAALPEAHLDFFHGLLMSASFGDYFFCHAGARPGVSLEAQTPQDLLWIREDFLDSHYAFDKMIVHGHTPNAEPEVTSGRIGIDTGAYITGVLTALVLEGASRRFLQTG
jgi:serine/threonine protein phosphatase 1